MDDTTQGKSAALEALRESERNRRRTQKVVQEALRQVRESARLRERNHFVDGVQNMLRGIS